MDVIVNFTPTGMIPTKRMSPYIPICISEIVEDVHEAWEIGITMVHLHARDEHTGEPTYKAEIYRNINSPDKWITEAPFDISVIAGRVIIISQHYIP